VQGASIAASADAFGDAACPATSHAGRASSASVKDLKITFTTT